MEIGSGEVFGESRIGIGWIGLSLADADVRERRWVI